MDDFWGTLTPESEKAFLHPLKAYPKLVRGRKHQWTKAEDSSIARSYREISYLKSMDSTQVNAICSPVDANDPSQSQEKICMEEMRITDPALDVTIAKTLPFAPEALGNKVLDLDYDDVSEEEIVLQHEFLSSG